MYQLCLGSDSDDGKVDPACANQKGISVADQNSLGIPYVYSNYRPAKAPKKQIQMMRERLALEVKLCVDAPPPHAGLDFLGETYSIKVCDDLQKLSENISSENVNLGLQDDFQPLAQNAGFGTPATLPDGIFERLGYTQIGWSGGPTGCSMTGISKSFMKLNDVPGYGYSIIKSDF